MSSPARRLVYSHIAAVAAVLAISPLPALAEVALKGKTVTIYIAGGAGGGVDLYARTIAPYLTRHLPGEPAVVASNMPGGGGVQAVQYLYNVAAKDGTAIGTTNAGPVAEPLLKGPGSVNYDLSQFRWVGSLVKGDTVCGVWHTSKIRSLDDARANEATLSSTGVTSAPTRGALLMNALIGTRFRPVAGYDGGTSLLAIERGEVDGVCNTLNSLRTTRPQWLKDKLYRPLVQVSMSADAELPDVPRAVDLIKDPERRQMLEFYLLPYEFNNPYYLPPGTADDVLAAWRKAFDSAVGDADYRADAAKRRQTVQPRPGTEVADLVARMFATPKAIIDRTIAATTPKN